MKSARHSDLLQHTTVAIFRNDGGHDVIQLTFLFTFATSDPELHVFTQRVGNGQSHEFRTQTVGICNGVFCTAYVELGTQDHLLLSQRTEYVDNAPGWDSYVFDASRMVSHPC